MFRTFRPLPRCLCRPPPLCHLIRFYSTTPNPTFLQDDTVPPPLLARARTLAAEHASLSTSIASSFCSKSAKRVGELSSVANALQEYEESQTCLSELQTLLADPSLDAELRSLATTEISTLTTQLSTTSKHLLTTLIPAHPFAHLPCLLEIRPGAGGGEASLFAGDLLRMYRSLCTRLSLPHSLLKYEDADGAPSPDSSSPLQEAILEIASPGAYSLLRTEAGVHRVQRVPLTEAKGRTHTSAASVLVLPSLPSSPSAEDEASYLDPTSDYYVSPSDVRTDVYRARGAGGQHVNTTDSAVRLTHVPTNTVVAMQDSRSQPKNREKAWRLLRAKIAQLRREEREEEVMRIRRQGLGKAKMGRGDKVRTYNWGQQRVTDHRSGESEWDLEGVVGGGEGLERLMGGVRAWLGMKEVEGMVALEEEERKKKGKEM